MKTLDKSYISIVLPLYNEEHNVETLISQVNDYLSKNFSEYEIIPVNDGSKDNTGKLLEEEAKKNNHVHPVNYSLNKGYGGALKSGIAAAKGDYVAYMDGDLQFDIKDFDKLWKEHNNADMIIGYRKDRKDNEVRKLNARMWNIFMKTLFHTNLKVRDIDCGFKLLSRKVVDSLDVESDGALFSTEMLIKVSKMKFKIIEVEVNHYPRINDKPTGGNLKVIKKAFSDLFKLYKVLK